MANLALIGLLPRLFFRRDGNLNVRWWLTGLPFFVSAGALTAGRLARLPRTGGMGIEPASTVAVLLAVVSIGVIAWTIGSHRAPLALWHQDNDAPRSIVTWGPYRYVRHPFYASFLLTQTAAVLVFPNPVTAAALVYAIAALSLTARREERRLLESTFGTDYRTYMATTGRLVPKVGKVAA